MKISLNWASHWTQVPAYDADALGKFSHTYSTYTADVEEVIPYIFDQRIIVGRVEGWNPHPDSEKLTLVDVDAGAHGKHTIVCGALNVRESKYVATALEGTVMPGGMAIGKRNIKGVDSCGMICSAGELGLPDTSDHGILPLEDVWDVTVLEEHLGKPFGELVLLFPGYSGDIRYAMSDVIFDLDNKFITNRPDLFSVIGNAREVSTINRGNFEHSPLIRGAGGFLDKRNTDEIGVKIQSDSVINYLLSEYTLPEVPPSSFVIQTLLARSGQGAHGLLADLTNIVMTETGQPMHVFDADTIVGNIVLRLAKNDEQFIGLDSKTYSLSSEDLVIVDDEKVLALAGIMGGLSSGATEKTRRIFVESATFDPVRVRKTSQRLGIRTDSSIRFEKGVDPLLPEHSDARYVQLLTYYIPGIAPGARFVHTSSYAPTNIDLTHEQIEKKIGKEVSEKDIEDILSRLGFVSTINDKRKTINIVVPSWRDTGDIGIPEDAIEEIARHIGYETIPSQALPGPLSVSHIHSYDELTQSIASFFGAFGYLDTYTYPFTLPERFAKFTDAKPCVIENTSENRTHLRAHMAESLLELVKNSYRNHPDGALFEFGPTFDGEEKLAGLGVSWGIDLDQFQDHLTKYMMTYFGTPGQIIQGAGNPTLFAPRAYAEYFDEKGDVTLRFGLVRPTLLALFDIEGVDVFSFEIVKMPTLHRSMKFAPIVEYPGTTRELNFIVPDDTPVAVVLDLVRSVHPWISRLGVSQVYRDADHIGVNKKSVIVSFLLRNNEATITDIEAGKIQEDIIKKLAEAGYPLRGN